MMGFTEGGCFEGIVNPLIEASTDIDQIGVSINGCEHANVVDQEHTGALWHRNSCQF